MKISFEADANGTVCGFSYHDGLLVCIDVSSEQIVLRIKNSAGDSYAIELDDVAYFLATNFREGNIIDSMYIWDIRAAPDTVRQDLASAGLRDSDLRRMEGKRLFLLECSYGAKVLAVAANVEMQSFEIKGDVGN